MKSRILLSTFSLLAILGCYASADEVLVKGREKPVVGDIRSEDAKGIIINTLVDKKKVDVVFPAVDVLDVHYDDVKPVTLNLAGGSYRVAKDADKDATDADAAKRKAAYGIALKNYADTLAKMMPHKNAKRTIDYRIAMLTLQLARAEQLSTDKALVKLQAFKTANPSCWHLVHVMPTIAEIQLSAKDYKGAETTFQEMAEMDVLSASARLSAELEIVQVNILAGTMDRAQKKLDELTKRAAKNPTMLSQVNMARAEVLIGQNKGDEAVGLLKKIVKDSTDKKIKAMAHNALGESYYKKNRYSEAVWEFLWVDAVFNQDRNQHARALYYLWKTFEVLNNAERAQECREMLLNDRQFAGTDFQRKGAAEAK